MRVYELPPLRENLGVAFHGDVAPMSLLVVSPSAAERWIERPKRPNPDGRSNRAVLRPLIWDPSRATGIRAYVIDFGVGATEEEARAFVEPFDYVEREMRIKHPEGYPYWLLRTIPPPYAAVERLPRFVATSLLASPHLFVWARPPAIPADSTIVFARDDDAFFGVLCSSVHRAWISATPPNRSGIRYNQAIFETFPLPRWREGEASHDAVARAAAALDARREAWCAEERAATQAELVPWRNLYGTPPAWLTEAHAALDEAVLEAYGLARGTTDEAIVERLVRLREERLAAG